MDKEYYIQLTDELYQLTLLFPKKEPLRYKIREVANDILASLVGDRKKSNPSPLKDKLEVIDALFELAKKQNWVKQYDVLNLQQEYCKLNECPKENEVKNKEEKIEEQGAIEIVKTAEPAEALRAAGEVKNTGEATEEARVVLESAVPEAATGKESYEIPTSGIVTERQKKILKVMKRRDKIQVWEAKKFFPEVSKRTLRRDFESMLKQGIIKRIGEKNDTYYQLS